MTDTSSLVFTRYLYPKYCVKHSLMLALLERQRDEAMFWGYELYFSGFQEETMVFIESLYNILYRKQNPGAEQFIAKMLDCWRNEAENSETCLGSIIYSLIARPYDITEFVETILVRKCCPADDNCALIKKPINIILNSDNISKYKTISTNGAMRPHKILKECCRFPIRSNISELFGSIMTSATRRQCYLKNWLYFAAMSPVWRERIEEYGGMIDDTIENVVFEDDDLENEFRELWDYETDEQSSAIHHICIGDESVSQITISEFCEKYGANLAAEETQPLVKKVRKRLVIREGNFGTAAPPISGRK